MKKHRPKAVFVIEQKYGSIYSILELKVAHSLFASFVGGQNLFYKREIKKLFTHAKIS